MRETIVNQIIGVLIAAFVAWLLFVPNSRTTSVTGLNDNLSSTEIHRFLFRANDKQHVVNDYIYRPVPGEPSMVDNDLLFLPRWIFMYPTKMEMPEYIVVTIERVDAQKGAAE